VHLTHILMIICISICEVCYIYHHLLFQKLKSIENDKFNHLINNILSTWFAKIYLMYNKGILDQIVISYR
jgi:hypothetical protein